MKLFYFVLTVALLVAPSVSEESNEKDDTVAYVKASLPNQIYRCVTKFNLLRCFKFFVLLRLESREYQIAETDASTSEFLGSILRSEKNLPNDIPVTLLELDEEELNSRLTKGFQKFFRNRPIMLRFIPNMLVKIIPSKSNDLEFSIKKYGEKDFTSRSLRKTKDSDESEEEKDETVETLVLKDEAEKTGLRKKSAYLSLGLPLLFAPAMIFAGFLPMLIPVLKFATAFTVIINSFALLSAIVYLARQHALDREMQQTVYFNPGYKERK